ncbi:MAG: hypothetical protein RDU13_07090 [Elusimicrobiales bacterium]|jgi:hypothetical protein|nr:hypothetical protein [Elusimicrobiales bacterium]
MSAEIILITVSSIILVSYLFDFFSSRTRVPQLVFLILSGVVIRVLMDRAGWTVPYLHVILPPLGTLGLILIVLEAGLDLELGREKVRVIRAGLFSAFFSLLATLGLIAAFYKLLFPGAELRVCLVNALPLAVMSSAIAIPGVSHLPSDRKEFIVYESSLSDILGILVFNFLVLNETFGPGAYFAFGFEIIATIMLSLVFSLALAALIERVDHKIKYLPVFSVLLLVYALAKMMHFSPLILVLVFGLFANNIGKFVRGNLRFYFDVDRLRDEMGQFGAIVRETTFVIKTFFFLLLGYSADLRELFSPEAFRVALPVLGFIYIGRWLPLKRSAGEAAHSLAYIAPRGLITILLYLSIPPHLLMPGIPPSTLVLLILATALILAWGVMKPDTPAQARLKRIISGDFDEQP